MRFVVQASGGEERMVARKHSVPAWRTAQVGEKFGINAAAFKMTFPPRGNWPRLLRNRFGAGCHCDVAIRA